MKTYPDFSSVARGRLTKSKNSTGFFSRDTRGQFVPKNHLRFFRRTQTFPPNQIAQDSRESLWKFYSTKSTPVFSSHANFSAKTECPRFHGEPVEIQTSQPHHVHVQWLGCVCFLPLKSTLLCCHPEYLLFRWRVCLPSILCSRGLPPALTEVLLTPATGLRAA